MDAHSFQPLEKCIKEKPKSDARFKKEKKKFLKNLTIPVANKDPEQLELSNVADEDAK